MKPKREFWIELDISNWGIESDGSHRPWANADVVSAGGSTFEEALDSAEVFFTGDDGDNCFSCPFDGSYMTSEQFDEIERELASAWAREVDKKGAK